MATQANRLNQFKQFLKLFWAFIVGVSILSAIIGVVIALLTLRQAEQAAQASDVVQVTVIALMKAQLSVQQEIATAQANPAPPGPTATAVAERVVQLIATQDVLEAARQRLEARQTAVAQSAPTGNGAIAYGQILPGAITLPAEQGRYTFVGKAGDVVLIVIAKTSGEFWPQIRLYNPDGKEIKKARTPGVSTELNETLPADGDYVILVSDGSDGAHIGEYNLNLQKIR